MQSTPCFNLEHAQYAIKQTPHGISVTPPVKDGKLVSTRRQCAMYCNDAIGIPGYFTNLFEEKLTRITTDVPKPGSVALLKIALPYGHVLLIEEVGEHGQLTWSESNYDDKEHFRKMTGTIDDLQKRKLIGFTEGLGNQWNQHQPSPWAVASIEKAKKKGIMDWNNPQEIIGTPTLAYIMQKLGALSQINPEGVSKEQFIVSLDHLHLLD